MNIRRILAAVALAWVAVNAAGLVIALRNREGMHSLTHAVLVVVLAGAAAWLWRKPHAPQSIALPDARVDMLHDEINHLQRELDEAKQGRDFAEQLLATKRKADGSNRNLD